LSHIPGRISHGLYPNSASKETILSDPHPHAGPQDDSDWSSVLGLEARTAEPVSASELAAQLAGRLCHDLIAPASAIISGFDLLEDPSMADMRADAMNLIKASAQKTVALVTFSRVAFGASNTAEDFAAEDLRRLAESVFSYVRAQLEWAVELPIFNKPAARALLNLAQIGGDAVPTGGVVRIMAHRQGDEILLSVEATSPRARLRPETLQGLHGEALSEGLGGYWVQAYYLQALLKAAGGRVDATVGEGRVVLRARCPA
jgi:histidine phosphotransferase ChpT